MSTPSAAALERWAFWCACGSAATSLVSIAACHTLLVLALLLLLLSRTPVKIPPVAVPLALFVVGTLISLALSDDRQAGLSQLKKFFVYLFLPVIYTLVRAVEDIYRLLLAWCVAGSASALWSFVEFWNKRQEAITHGWNFYSHYIGERVTGFMSHWMTFGSVQMMALLMVLALAFFAPIRRFRPLLWLGITIIATSIVLSFTRSVWLGCVLGGSYLLAVYRPRLLAAMPLLLVVIWFIAPPSVRDRATSIYQPHGTLDSNLHRDITRRVGVEMVKSHPWFGLGPDVVGREFKMYLPPDIPQPLPTGFYGHLHNLYLQYAAERGVLTLLAFLWFIGKAAFDFARGVRGTHASRRAILHGAIACILAILAEALFEVNLGDSEVLGMFLIVIAAGYIALLHPNEEPDSAGA